MAKINNNLSIFKFDNNVTANQLLETFSLGAAHSVGSHEVSSVGWGFPAIFGETSVQYNNGNNMILDLLTSTRYLPSSIVNQELDKKIDETEAQQGRTLSANEITAIKDELIFEMLPKTFSIDHHANVGIDMTTRTIVMDSSSSSDITAITNLLGNRTYDPVNDNFIPGFEIHKPDLSDTGRFDIAMTQWLLNEEAPSGFTVGRNAGLVSLADDGNGLSLTNRNLFSMTTENLLNAGNTINKMAMSWEGSNGGASFSFNDKGQVSSVKYSGMVLNGAGDMIPDSGGQGAGSAAVLATSAVQELATRLIQVTGGSLKTIPTDAIASDEAIVSTGVYALTGDGSDNTYIVSHTNDEIIETAGSGVDVVFSIVDFALADNVENLALVGTGELVGIGNSLSNTLIGGDGNALLSGGAGLDQLIGKTGNDVLNGDGGNDYIIGGSGTNVLTGGAGHDIFDLSGLGINTDTITDWGLGDDVLLGKLVTGAQLNVTISDSSLQEFSSAALGGVVDITGGSANDTITGGSGSDTISGGLGDDLINAGRGNDIVDASGNDTITLGVGNDLVNLSVLDGGATVTDFLSNDQLHLYDTGLQAGNLLSETFSDYFGYDTLNHTLSFDADGLGTLETLQIIGTFDGVTDMKPGFIVIV